MTDFIFIINLQFIFIKTLSMYVLSYQYGLALAFLGLDQLVYCLSLSVNQQSNIEYQNQLSNFFMYFNTFLILQN